MDLRKGITAILLLGALALPLGAAADTAAPKAKAHVTSWRDVLHSLELSKQLLYRLDIPGDQSAAAARRTQVIKDVDRAINEAKEGAAEAAAR